MIHQAFEECLFEHFSIIVVLYRIICFTPIVKTKELKTKAVKYHLTRHIMGRNRVKIVFICIV